MAKKIYGLASLKMGGINSTTGLPENLADVGDVFKNSCLFGEEDGQVTEHRSEFSQFPIVKVNELGTTTLQFRLMDMEADEIVALKGGTVTAGDSSPNVYNSPSDIVNIEKSFEITTDDGTVITINRGDVMAKVNSALSKQGLTTLDVVVTVLQPNVGTDVPPYTITDNYDQPAA